MARQSARLTTPAQRRAKATGELDSQAEPETGFFETLTQFTPEEWRGMKIYVYRLWPVIDRKEKEHFLSKLQEPCDEDFLLSTFGTGKYYLRLNNKQGNTIASHTVSVYNQQHPPRVNPEEVVVSDPENDRYFKTWGKPQPAPDSNGGVVADIARAALEGNRRPSLDPQILGLWEKTNAERDNLAQRLVELSQKQPAQPTAEPIVVLREMLGLMREMQPPAQPPPPVPAADPFQVWERIEGFLQKARGPEPAPVLAENDSTTSMLQAIAGIMQSAPQVIHAVISGVDYLRRERAGGAGQPGGTAMSGPQSHPEPAATEDTEQPEMTLEQRIEEVMTLGYAHMQQGVGGAEFASWVCGQYPRGPEVFATLAPHGSAGVLALMSMSPQSRAVVNDPAVRPRLEEFLNEFFSFDPAPEAAQFAPAANLRQQPTP
jgi:hypothetical protein